MGMAVLVTQEADVNGRTSAQQNMQSSKLLIFVPFKFPIFKFFPQLLPVYVSDTRSRKEEQFTLQTGLIVWLLLLLSLSSVGDPTFSNKLLHHQSSSSPFPFLFLFGAVKAIEAERSRSDRNKKGQLGGKFSVLWRTTAYDGSSGY